MPIQKNNTEKEEEKTVPKIKINRSLLTSSNSSKEEKKVGRKAFEDENLKSDKRNTFLLNAYQQEKLEERMRELGIKNKTDYILALLKKDIIDL